MYEPYRNAYTNSLCSHWVLLGFLWHRAIERTSDTCACTYAYPCTRLSFNIHLFRGYMCVRVCSCVFVFYRSKWLLRFFIPGFTLYTHLNPSHWKATSFSWPTPISKYMRVGTYTCNIRYTCWRQFILRRLLQFTIHYIELVFTNLLNVQRQRVRNGTIIHDNRL